MGSARPAGPPALPAAPRRSDRRQRRSHRHRRMRGHGDAAGVAASARDRPRCAQLPRLRRARRRLQRARLELERDREPRRAHALGPGGRDHALERPLHALDLEDGPGPRRRLHGRAQAGRVVAAFVLVARRPRRRGRAAARRLQRRSGDRRDRGRGAGRQPRGAPDLVHRLAADGARDRALPRPRTSSHSPASSAARARCWSSPTPTSTTPPAARRRCTTTPARSVSRALA